ncbi:MAG: carbonic anhydrase [Anaerolineae bacterium]|nr:carbonic anhydrase [Anaerolineae bacterium]
MPTDRILAGIGRFRTYFEENRELFELLADKGQAPHVLFIGCADSRAAPELITQCNPGDLFVTRNVGNIVPPYGSGQTSIGAVVEFAVMELAVRHIVLCGHTDCGAIRGLERAVDRLGEPHIARWIEYARPAKTQVEAGGLPDKDRHLATVRANVLLQLENLRSYDPVREGERSGTLTLHGWAYHLETGFIEAYDSQTRSWRPVESAGT